MSAALEKLPDLLALLDRYQGRISARVAEDSGGLFDVCLSVDGLDIAALRLRSSPPIMLFRNTKGEPAAMDRDGALVPLP